MDDDQIDLFSYNGGFAPSKTRADQIEAAFTVYFTDNPLVWKYFKQFTFEAIAQGFTHYGSAAIIEQVRWHINMKTVQEDGFKIRNDFRAYYARLFHIAFPQYDGFFHTRHRRSTERPEFPGDPSPTADPPEVPDAGLNQRLQNLLDATSEEEAPF